MQQTNIKITENYLHVFHVLLCVILVDANQDTKASSYGTNNLFPNWWG